MKPLLNWRSISKTDLVLNPKRTPEAQHPLYLDPVTLKHNLDPVTILKTHNNQCASLTCKLKLSHYITTSIYSAELTP